MDWCTPQDFFDQLNKEFNFVLDVAATDKTAKCPLYYTPDYIYGKAEIRFVRGRLYFTDEKGNAGDPAPFPSMIVIYNGNKQNK